MSGLAKPIQCYIQLQVGFAAAASATAASAHCNGQALGGQHQPQTHLQHLVEPPSVAQCWWRATGGQLAGFWWVLPLTIAVEPVETSPLTFVWCGSTTRAHQPGQTPRIETIHRILIHQSVPPPPWSLSPSQPLILLAWPLELASIFFIQLFLHLTFFILTTLAQ